MIKHLKETLELLRERTAHNLEIIRMNEKIVKAMLKKPVSDKRTEQIEERYQENKKLLNIRSKKT